MVGFLQTRCHSCCCINSINALQEQHMCMQCTLLLHSVKSRERQFIVWDGTTPTAGTSSQTSVPPTSSLLARSCHLLSMLSRNIELVTLMAFSRYPLLGRTRLSLVSRVHVYCNKQATSRTHRRTHTHTCLSHIHNYYNGSTTLWQFEIARVKPR